MFVKHVKEVKSICSHSFNNLYLYTQRERISQISANKHLHNKTLIQHVIHSPIRRASSYLMWLMLPQYGEQHNVQRGHKNKVAIRNHQKQKNTKRVGMCKGISREMLSSNKILDMFNLTFAK